MLTIERLNQFYGDSHTLWDLSFGFPARQCTCVMAVMGSARPR